MTTIAASAMPQEKRPGIFSLRGRIGRARYIAYTLGAIVGAFCLMSLAGLALLLSANLGRTLYVVFSIGLLYCVLPLYFMALTVRRAHDFNAGGWLALLLLVPVVNLVFWFIPGTRGDNSYGAPPQAATSGIRIAAVLLPLLLIGAFIASEGGRTESGDSAAETASPPTSLRPYTP